MANKEHLKILEQGIDVWNKWRIENQQIIPDLSGVDLSKYNLRNADFSYANLSGANLCWSDLRKATFRGAKLYKAVLEDVIIFETDFSEANLEEANLILLNTREMVNVECSGWITTFRRSNLQKASLVSANLDGVDFTEANLAKVKIYDASLKNTDFSKANLSGVSFSKYDYIDEIGKSFRLGEDDLCDVKLTKAKFINTNFSNANFIGVHFNSENLRGVIFNGSNFSNADLRWTNFKKIRLFQVNFKEAVLTKANLNQARFEKVNFEKSNLHKADLCDAKFIRSNLKHSNLSEAIIRNVTFVKSNLKGVKFTYADLSDSLFNSVLLTGACFHRSSISFWNIRNIKCKYVYLDSQRKNRYPKDRNFEPREFERLYRSIPTIEFIFEKGLRWIDIFAFGSVENNLQKDKPEFQAKLISIDRKGTHPRVIFEVVSEIIKEEAEKEIRRRFEETIEILNIESERQYNIIQQLLKYPRQLTVGRDYIQAQGDVHITNIEISKAIEEIKQIVEKEPEASFKGKSKKKILEYLDHTGKDLTKEGIKKILTWSKNELVPLIPKLLTQVGTLENIWKTISP
jgi:uncharacterized protein YjbI with pentapeptide repeats